VKVTIANVLGRIHFENLLALFAYAISFKRLLACEGTTKKQTCLSPAKSNLFIVLSL